MAEPWRDSVAVQIQDGRHVGQSVTMVERMDGAFEGPTFRLTATAAQVLMDDLWACGFRPSEGAGSAGAMAAVQAHLADMRRLVFELPVKPK